MSNELTAAILSGDLNQVSTQLASGADLEELDEYGFTPLIEATIAYREDIVARLLKAGSNVDTRDITGRSALHWAADNNHLAICQLLLEHGSDPNAYTDAGQPVLVLPYLRGQTALKKLFYQHQASLNFAQDFIQVKLIGHRYELMGQADITDTHGRFVAVNYEGFFLEFVVAIIQYSLERYCRHFVARSFQDSFPYLRVVIQLLKRAARLLQYQKYTVDLKTVDPDINRLLDSQWLLLPLAYEGHAVSFIQYQDILVRCDRGDNSHREGSIVMYRMKKPYAWNKALIKQLLYQRQDYDFIINGIKTVLGLEIIGNIPIEAQLVGNCTWANIEASVLALLYLLRWKKNGNTVWQPQFIQQVDCHLVYENWLAWDKARALEDCIQHFKRASPSRKATIATILGAVLFQSLDYQKESDVVTARKLMPILMEPHYQYILKSYFKVYWHDRKTPEGHRFRQLLDVCGSFIKL